MIDAEMLEAMREVDALTPSCPPISPQDPVAGQLVEVDCAPEDLPYRAGYSKNSGMAMMYNQGLANAANAPTTNASAIERARGMQNVR